MALERRAFTARAMPRRVGVRCGEHRSLGREPGWSRRGRRSWW